MSKLSNQFYRVVKDQVSCEVGGEAVILHFKDGVYYGLNEVGAVIWAQLQQEPRTICQLKDKIVQEFEVRPDEAERDLQNLMGELLASGLIEVQESEQAK